VRRDGALILVDDDRLLLRDGEKPELKRVRFRTLGCYPLTGAIESDASTVAEVVAEMRASKTSERQGRLIDLDESGSMENKKREGYF
jgi:sulfate adenylyltransferase subunit 2